MEKGFSKEKHEEGHQSPDSSSISMLKPQGISEYPTDKESRSSVLDSSGSKPLSKDDDNDVEADSNENDQVEGNTEAAKRKNIQGQEEGKEGSSQFKGVVSQKNGHWGAQLYCHTRKWLGTFKTKEEAAKAYARACIKFRGQHGQLNFPTEPVLEAEKLFQDSLAPEEVVGLIKDHNYDKELHRWYDAHPRHNSLVSGNQNISKVEKMGKDMIPEGPLKDRQHLFGKQMTASDVGKLNRLVIPKQHAEHHFPKDKLDVESETFLTFVDASNGREWQFRFSFWKSSQSYVLTRGWRKFVKDKDLKEGDTVSFSRDSKMPSNKFYITVHVPQDSMSNNCVHNQSGSYELLQAKRFNAKSSLLSSVKVPNLNNCEPMELVKSQEKNRVDQNTDQYHIHYPSHQKTSNHFHASEQLGKRKSMEDESENKSDGVLKLFGVAIGPKGKKQKDDGVEIDLKAKKQLEIQINPKEEKQKDGGVEIDSKAKKLFEIEIDPEAKGQEDVDLTLRL